MSLDGSIADIKKIQRRYRAQQLRARLKSYGFLFLIVFLGIGIAQFEQSKLGRQLNGWELQQSFVVRGIVSHPEEIILVALDDTIVVKPSFAIPRRVFAEGLEKIVQAAPKLVIIDGPLPKSDEDPEADQRIAKALAAVPSTVATGRVYTDQNERGYITESSDEIFIAAASKELSMTVIGHYDVAQYLTQNKPSGTPISEQLPYMAVLPSELLRPFAEPPKSYDLINFYGPAGTIRRITLKELIDKDSAFATSHLKGRIVFVGFQALGNYTAKKNLDEFSISASPYPMYGVEIHANIVGNILDHGWLRQIDVMTKAALVTFLATVILAACVYLPPGKAGILVFLLLVVLTVLNYLLFAWYRVWIGGLITLWFVPAIGAILAYFKEDLHLQRLQNYLNKRIFWKQ